MDDWEVVADALVVENKNPSSESSSEFESIAELVSSRKRMMGWD